MQNLRKILTIFVVISLNTSCAMIFNDRTVEVPVSSNPPGADIYINGMHYGQTPAIIKIEPTEWKYEANLIKEGYGSTTIKMETWQSLRGGCWADMLGAIAVIPIYSLYSIYCRDFKKKEYHAEIPNLSGGRAPASRGFSPYDNPYGNFNQTQSAPTASPSGYYGNNPKQSNQQNNNYNPYDTPYNSGNSNQQDYYQPYGGQQNQPTKRID